MLKNSILQKKSKSRIFEQYNLLLRACSSEPSLIPSVVSNFFQNEAHIAFQSRACKFASVLLGDHYIKSTVPWALYKQFTFSTFISDLQIYRLFTKFFCTNFLRFFWHIT